VDPLITVMMLVGTGVVEELLLAGLLVGDSTIVTEIVVGAADGTFVDAMMVSKTVVGRGAEAALLEPPTSTTEYVGCGLGNACVWMTRYAVAIKTQELRYCISSEKCTVAGWMLPRSDVVCCEKSVCSGESRLLVQKRMVWETIIGYDARCLYQSARIPFSGWRRFTAIRTVFMSLLGEAGAGGGEGAGRADHVLSSKLLPYFTYACAHRHWKTYESTKPI